PRVPALEAFVRKRPKPFTLAANLGCPCLAEFHDIHRHPAWQGAILGATAATPHENISINQIDNEGFGFPLPLQLPVHQHTQIAVIRNKADIFGVTESLEPRISAARSSFSMGRFSAAPHATLWFYITGQAEHVSKAYQGAQMLR
ncbi:hypothetical protein, partial [Novosphingobium sp. CCH12-A3]|uniref:hypothetical protein n=1 Tax=Novosphingobium sp. CCH12-A3 TaxID=1768752 RepID=UPI001E458927